VLALAVTAVAIWIMQALVFDPTAATQAHVAQLLMVAGALIVSTIERHIEDMAAAASLPELEHDPEKWEPVSEKIMLKQKARP
jgi:hypothetical protein